MSTLNGPDLDQEMNTPVDIKPECDEEGRKEKGYLEGLESLHFIAVEQSAFEKILNFIRKGQKDEGGHGQYFEA